LASILIIGGGIGLLVLDFLVDVFSGGGDRS